MATSKICGDSARDDGAGDPRADRGDEPSAAARARTERNRLRARALRDARLAARPDTCGETGRGGRAADPAGGGGGFLPESAADPPPRAVAPSAPVADPAERPRCLHCGLPFAHSHLFESFGYAACDACRDDEEAHALVTRTEAKGEYLLKECDLDLREPPLRCVRRRNPHGARFGDMRLYLRAQVQARALLVWGSEERLREERERREAAAARARLQRERRRLRALRMDVRSSLYDGTRARQHEHEFGPERHDAEADEYSRACTACGHVETYEKM